jgi:mono/diheme cytochrome c family protein
MNDSASKRTEERSFPELGKRPLTARTSVLRIRPLLISAGVLATFSLAFISGEDVLTKDNAPANEKPKTPAKDKSAKDNEAAVAKRDLPPEDRKVYDDHVLPFLKKYCHGCHGEAVRKAGLRLDDLGPDFLMGKNADVWKEVIDNINLGKMPPKSATTRPAADESFPVVAWVGRQLKRAEREAAVAGGHVLIRRLNRFEYASTVRDLFDFDEHVIAKIADNLPNDGVADGFDRISTALLLDRTQLRRYLDVGEEVAQQAIVSGPPPKKGVFHFSALKNAAAPEDTYTLAIPTFKDGKVGSASKKIPRGASVGYGPTRFDVKPNGVEWRCGPASTFLETHGVRPLDPKNTQQHVLRVNDLVHQDGYYRVRLRAGADKGERGEPVRVQIAAYKAVGEIRTNDAQTTLTIDAPLDQPRDFEAVVYLHKPLGEDILRIRATCNFISDLIINNPPVNNLLLAFGNAHRISDLRETRAPESEIRKLEALVAEAAKKGLACEEPLTIFNPKFDPEKAPRLLFVSLEIEGPIVPQWPPAGCKRLLFDGESHDDEAYVRAVFERFLPRAFRRPPEKAEVDRYVARVMSAMRDHGISFAAAMRLGVKAVLCSPAFLYISEPTATDLTRRLNDFELASRLSYFLWTSMPDDELFEQARSGKLGDPRICAAQVTRMIQDPKSRRFVESFAGQWLNVRDFGSVAPGREYNKYYDDALLAASKEEPFAFFGQVLKHDLPILKFLDSDFLVINERLATHYGIDGVTGEEFRQVALKPEHHRGGVLGMAGLMTLLSDGSRTLPVRRGAWVLDRLFNDPPPPPPPNAGEIQPATGDAKTVRQRLERHRNEATCASCHTKIDALGVALENYDAIGRWRTKSNGERYGDSGPPIDVSGQLPSGRSFKDLEGYKQALLADKDRFTRALVEKMLTYALGRSVGYVDKAAVEQIQAKVQSSDYRIQSLIQAIVASDVFRTK